MKKLLALALFALVTHSLYASHLYSAYISYELVDADELEYVITLTTFNDSRSTAAHRSEIELLLGYGSPEASVKVPIDKSEEKIVVDEFVIRNKYSITHRFPESDKCYTLTYVEPNSASYILNIDNALRTPHKSSTELCLRKDVTYSKSPLLNDSLIIYAPLHEKVEFNTKVRDFEGDLLELSLVTNGDNYKSPKDFSPEGSIYKITDKSILWSKPTRVGAYQLRFRIDEFREIDKEKVKIGSIEVFVMAFVQNGTGIEDISEDFPMYYALGALNFAKLESPATARIFNLAGQLLTQQSLEIGQNQLPIETTDGPFIVTIESNDGLVQRKLISQ